MSFLISSQRTFERDALSEAYYVISDVLGYETHPIRSRVPGLSLLRLNEDVGVFEVIEEISQYIKEKGFLVACLKIVPIERLIKTDLTKITEIAVSLAKKKILSTHSWKVHVRKRQTNLGTFEVIEKVAAEINWGVVNLTKPNFEIRIEIVRDLTGISVMEPRFELSMVRMSTENENL
jgi:tRNA(Ser,Leu) C12 N-acetylase TAN1